MMSILQELEQIRKSLRPGEFEAMEQWLELNPQYYLSDIYYRQDINKLFHDWWDKIKEEKVVKEMLRRIEQAYSLEEGELDRFMLEEDEDIRTCDECGDHMTEGFVVDGGCEYYCSQECLHKHYTPEEWADMYGDGNTDSYWTEWEQEQEEYQGITEDDVIEGQARYILQAIDGVVRNNYGSENNLWVSEEESDLTEEIPGMIHGSYDECLQAVIKILKGDE